MTSVAIIHNHPIHYKHLLFRELGKSCIDFIVLFSGGSSRGRIETPLPSNDEYRYLIGFAGAYEDAPSLHVARFVWQTLNRLCPEIVIISGYYDVAAWVGWVWAERNRAGKIIWAESNEFDHKRKLHRELLKRCFLKKCDYAHVYGRSNREYLVALGMPENKISIKRAIADTAIFLNASHAAVPKPDRITLLYCGRYSPEKNLPMLFRALANVLRIAGKQKVDLQLVGYGPLEAELQALAADLDLTSNVVFAGKALQSELPKIYRSVHALILPSLSEPWGLVVNEAMLSGLPVLVSNQCGCAADLVTPNTGWTFNPSDEEEITSLLMEVTSKTKSELEKMGAEARAVASEYSPENCAKIVIETVSSILEGRRVSGGKMQKLQ